MGIMVRRAEDRNFIMIDRYIMNDWKLMRPFVGDGKMKRSIVADGNAAVEMALGLLSVCVLLYRGWS